MRFSKLLRCFDSNTCTGVNELPAQTALIVEKLEKRVVSKKTFAKVLTSVVD